MPAFAPPLVSDEIWSIVQFLHALSDAADFAGTDARLLAHLPVPAPDFNFELPDRGQQALLQTEAREDTLLILYSLPDSLARLRSLASQRHAFHDKRIRVLAMTAGATDAQAARAQTPGGETMLATPRPMSRLPTRCSPRAIVLSPVTPIDRLQRALRARWLGVPALPTIDGEIAAAQKLDSERPPSPQ